MATARFVPEEGLTGAAGVGEVNAFRAATRSTAPNPNLALNQFVGLDPVTGATVFDAVTWTDAAEADASWSDVILDGRLLERRFMVPRSTLVATSPGATSRGATSPGATCWQRQTSAGRTPPTARSLPRRGRR